MVREDLDVQAAAKRAAKADFGAVAAARDLATAHEDQVRLTRIIHRGLPLDTPH